MAINEEEILVRIINKVEGAEELIKEENLVRKLSKSNGDLSRTYEEQTGTQRKRATINEKTNKLGEKTVDVNTEILAQGPKFQLHFLGIMFGGMALNRAMTNLTSTSKEWVGIGELMATTMGVVMLPATLALLDEAVLPLMDALLSLPEETKLAIGVSVFGLEGIGKLLEVIGQVALFKIAFPAAFAGLIPKLKASLQSQIGKGVVVAVGLTIAWQSIDFIREGIDEGSLMTEIIGVIGIGTGLGLIGLTFVGVSGGLIGFSLGIGIGLIISWFIRENKKDDIANAIKTATRDMQGEFFEETGAGRTIKSLASGAGSIGGFLTNEAQISSIKAILPPIFGSKAVGGNISNSGLHFLHEGETVLRKDEAGTQNGNISVTYNVRVSDKREFEQMLRNNNQQLVRDVRRDSRI